MLVTKFLDVNEQIYMIMSFVPGEDLKVVESGFSGVAFSPSEGRERSDDRKYVCCSQAISGVAFFVSNTYFHCKKNWLYTNLLGAKKCFLLANTMT